MFRKKSANPEGRYRPTPRSAGQRNATVFSYHASRSARPSTVGRNEQVVTAAGKERRIMRLKWFRRSPFIAALVLLLIFTGLNLPVSDTPHVLAAQDARGGIFLRPSTAYAEAAQKALASSFRNSNKLTINARQLERDLERQFPELAKVTVSIPFIGTRPVVRLQPTTPTLLLATVSTELFVVDNNGRALVLATQVPGVSKLKLPVVKDENPLPVKAGNSVLPGSQVTFITEVIGQLNAKHLEIESLTLPASASELDVKVKGIPYFVKFNLMGNAREEAGAFLAVKQQLDREHKTPGSYVDVRVEDRAYYR